MTYKNELTTLPQFQLLVEIARSLESESTTAELGERAAIDDRDELMGALRMLEVQGVIHEVQGQRRQSLWHPGKRTTPRSETDQRVLVPYERIPKLLKHYGRTPIATEEIAREVWADEGKGHERVRGALKVLAVLGLVESGHYSSQAVTWWWRTAQHERPYSAGYFSNFREPLHVDLDDPVLNSRGMQIAENADEDRSFRDWQQDPLADL